MIIEIPLFAGVIKALDPFVIDPKNASDAQDARLDNGTLRPWLDLAQVLPSVPTGTVFKAPDTRLIAWSGVVHAVRSLVTGDSYGRIYYTDGVQPKVTDSTLLGATDGTPPSGYRWMGCPGFAAGAKPTVSSVKVKGRGEVTTVTLFTDTDKPPEVTTAVYTDADLRFADSVILDYPGFSTMSYRVKLGPKAGDGTYSRFYLTNYHLPKLKVDWFRVGDTAGTNLAVRCTGHGLAEGDKVFFAHSATWLDRTKVYTVQSVLSDDKFTIDETTGAGGAAKGVWGELAADGTPKTGGNNKGDIAKRGFWVVGRSNAVFNVLAISWGTSGATVTTAPTSGVTAYWTRDTLYGLLRDRSYLVTAFNGYGEEGAPCTPTDPVQVVDGSSVSFSAFPTVTDTTNYAIAGWKLYRTDALGAWRLVGSYLSGTLFPITDSLLDEQLGGALPSATYDLPPATLDGLIGLPGGYMCGYSGRDVLFSVPYQSHAWPQDYRFSTGVPVMGVVSTQAGVAVLTQGKPYLITGGDPETAQLVELDVPYACASSRSIVDMGAYAVYSSPFGLVAIAGNTATLLTQGVLTKEQWAAYAPASLVGAHYGGWYLGFNPNAAGSDPKGFMLNPETKDFVPLSLNFACAFAYFKDGLLYLVDTAGRLYTWNSGTTYRPFTWTSKLFILPRPDNFGCAQVIASAYPLTFEWYADGVLKHTQTVTSVEPFRLPSGYMGEQYQITLRYAGGATETRVRTVRVAETMAELKS